MDPSISVKRTVSRPVINVVVHLKGPQAQRQPLLVVLDEAGRQWARGVKLDEVRGRVVADNIELASVFTPSFAEVAIVCVNVRLPIDTIHIVASAIVSTMRPTSVVIIDAYPVPSYISPSSSPLEPPIRYLRTTAASNHLPPDDAEPFHPPNLIQSPAASFLSILESSTHATPATLLLLPSAHIRPPAPSEFEGCVDLELREDWEPFVFEKLQKIVGSVIGIGSSWSVHRLPDRSTRLNAAPKGDIGEGAMYI